MRMQKVHYQGHVTLGVIARFKTTAPQRLWKLSWEASALPWWIPHPPLAHIGTMHFPQCSYTLALEQEDFLILCQCGILYGLRPAALWQFSIYFNPWLQATNQSWTAYGLGSRAIGYYTSWQPGISPSAHVSAHTAVHQKIKELTKQRQLLLISCSTTWGPCASQLAEHNWASWGEETPCWGFWTTL